MNRTVSFALLGASAIALAACAQAQPAPQVGQVPILSDIPGSPTQRENSPRMTPAPTTGCQLPRRGQYTMRTDQIARDRTFQVQYQGRDTTFRTSPFVYNFQTNATLLNRDGSVRDNANFSLWQGQSQDVRVCGQALAIDLVRASDQQVVVNIRNR